MSELVSTTPDFAERHPRHSRDIGPRSLTNDTPDARNASGNAQESNARDQAGRLAKGEDSPCTALFVEFVDVECGLLSSAPRPQSHPAYKALGHDCIRLLRILPASSTDDIRCQLDEFTLHETLAYTALSYTWGSQHGVHLIYVNEEPLLVPKNLWRFLNHARGLAGDLTGWIWCDMLSINQVDLAERGHQVKLMSRIFKTARTVVVWLGPAYRGSDRAMTALARLPTGGGFAKQASNLWAGDAGHAMGGICSRPYWRRLWVFQEIWLAQKIRLMCGSKTAPWSHFHALMEYAHARSGTSQLDDNTEVVATSPAMRMTNLNIESVDTVLWSLVQETTHLRCFDIRDKIYALLGVATRGHESIEPDYSMPVPSLLNILLHEIWSDLPPENLEEAAEGCAKIEDVFGVKRGTIFIMQGQRGRYNAPSTAEMRHCRLGPKSSQFTLWWTAFYGHSRVQTLLRNSWSISYFDEDSSEQSDASRDFSLTSTPVVSLFQFLRKDMDSRSSFLGLTDVHVRAEAKRAENRNNSSLGNRSEIKGIEFKANRKAPLALQDLFASHQIPDGLSDFLGVGNVYAGHEIEDRSRRSSSLGLEDAHARLETENPESDAEATKIDASMAWVTFYLTDAIEQNDRHATRLMLDIGVDCRLRYTQYRTMATLVNAIRGTLYSTQYRGTAIFIEETAGAVALLKTIFSRAGPFISDTDRFVTEMLDHGRLLKQCSLLLELGLLDLVQPDRRAAMLNGALSKALLNNNEEAVEALLSTGECDPDCFVLGGPALFHCMHTLQQRSFRALLNTGKCDLNRANASNGMTPLMQAAWGGLSAYVRVLIETDGCQLNDTNPLDDMTPLFYAASRGHTGVVRELLADNRCDADTPHSRGKTAMDMAKDGRYMETVAILRSQRDVNVPDHLGNTPLGSASAKGFHNKVRTLLKFSNCDVNFVNDCGNAPLMLAVIGGHVEAVKELLACERCDVNQRGRLGRTALIAALRSLNWYLASIILDCGRCDVNVSDDLGTTPLMLSAAYTLDGHYMVGSLMETQGCDVNAEDNNGWTALIHAGYNQNAIHVGSLLRAKMRSIDMPSQKGHPTTVLRMAAYLHRHYFLERLLRAPGLDPRVRTHLVHTPLIVATSKLRRDNTGFLLGYENGCSDNDGWSSDEGSADESDECSVDVRSSGSNTAPSLDVLGDYEILCLLLSSLGMKDLTNKYGKLLSLVVRERGHTDIGRVLDMLDMRLRMPEKVQKWRLHWASGSAKMRTTRRGLRKGSTPGSRAAFPTALPRISYRLLPRSAIEVSIYFQVGGRQVR